MTFKQFIDKKNITQLFTYFREFVDENYSQIFAYFKEFIVKNCGQTVYLFQIIYCQKTVV